MSVLERLTRQDGIRAVIVGGKDGFAIASAPAALGELDVLASYGAAILTAADGLGAESRWSSLIGIVLEYQDLLISIDPLGEMAVTISLLEKAAALVPLRQSLKQLRGELLSALDSH